MTKVIKSIEAKQDSVAEYERGALEAIGPFGGADSIDPATVLAEARAEAERKVKEAYAEGMRRGTAAGQERFDTSVARAEDLLKSAGETMQVERAAFLESLETQVVDLAYSIAEHVLRREASVSRDLVESTARTALERLLDQEQVTLRVNPDDLKVLQEKQVTLLEDFPGLKQLEVIPDEEIAPGGCVATTQRLVVDAQLQSQLDRICSQLTD